MGINSLIKSEEKLSQFSISKNINKTQKCLTENSYIYYWLLH